MTSSNHGSDHNVAQPFDRSILERLTPTLKRFTLSGKVAIVTGGARGLGYAMAQALAEAGARGIAIMDVHQANGDESSARLTKDTGADVRFIRVDITNEHAVTESVDAVVKSFGRLDILINSAGIADSNMPAETYSTEKFRRLMDINVTGSFLMAKACAKHMIPSHSGGSIIFIASMSGIIVNYPQEQCAYNASKAAVAQLCKSMAAEWAQFGIRVNAISPGYMDTPLTRQHGLDAVKSIWKERTPQHRLGDPDELGNLAVFLAADGSSYMTGANCVIDGGYTLW